MELVGGHRKNEVAKGTRKWSRGSLKVKLRGWKDGSVVQRDSCAIMRTIVWNSVPK